MSPKLNVYPSPLLKSMKKERYWRPLLGKRISSFLNKFNESGPRVRLAILSRNGNAHLPWWFSSPCWAAKRAAWRLLTACSLLKMLLMWLLMVWTLIESWMAISLSVAPEARWRKALEFFD